MFLKTEEKDILNCFLLYQSSGSHSGYYNRIFKKTDRINLIYLSYCSFASIEPVLDICSSERIINLKKEHIRENDCLLINENDYINFLTNIFQKLNQHIFDINLVKKINQIIDDLIVSNKLILLSTNKISYYEQTLQISDLVLQNLMNDKAKQCSSLPSNCEKCEIIPQYDSYWYDSNRGRGSDRIGDIQLSVQYFYYYVVLTFSHEHEHHERPSIIVINREIYEKNPNPADYKSEFKDAYMTRDGSIEYYNQYGTPDNYKKFRLPDEVLIEAAYSLNSIDTTNSIDNLYMEIKENSSNVKVKVRDWEVINGLLQDYLYDYLYSQMGYGRDLHINYIHLSAHKYTAFSISIWDKIGTVSKAG